MTLLWVMSLFFEWARFRVLKVYREEKLACFCRKAQVGINDDH